MFFLSGRLRQVLLDVVTTKGTTDEISSCVWLEKMERKIYMSSGHSSYIFLQVMKQSNGTLPPTSAWPSVLESIGTLPLTQRVLSGGIIRQLVPNMPHGQVDDACYTDSMDTVDSLVAMKKWALDSKF